MARSDGSNADMSELITPFVYLFISFHFSICFILLNVFVLIFVPCKSFIAYDYCPLSRKKVRLAGEQVGLVGGAVRPIGGLSGGGTEAVRRIS